MHPSHVYRLDRSTGELLDNETFYADFQDTFWNCTRFWKIESAQHFAEPGSASWQAFNAGDWDGALRLHDDRTQDLLDYHDRCNDHGIRTQRVRIIDTPLTPYLQWEMHLLFLRDATGGPIRILTHDTPTLLPKQFPHFPEVCGMDTTVLYEHLYDGHGVMYATVKYTNPRTIVEYKYLHEILYGKAAPIGPYFLRHIKPLPAPTITEQLPPDYLEQHHRPAPPKS